MINKICIVCNNKSFKSGKTCSKPCENQLTFSHKQQNQVRLQCAWCDKLVVRTKTKLKLLKERAVKSDRLKVYCSASCHNEYMKYVKHDAYKHSKGKRNYGPNWSSVRHLARQAVNYKCFDCNISEESYGKELSVHHIVPFVSFDNYKEANQLSNLVAICEPCHRLRHSGLNHPTNFTTFGKNAKSNKLRPSTLNKLILADLIVGTLTYDEIAKKHNVPTKKVKLMNTGIKCVSITRGFNFPISRYADFHNKYGNRAIPIDLLPNILNDLLLTSDTCKAIAEKYNVSDHLVRAISRGDLYKELHNYKTPMR